MIAGTGQPPRTSEEAYQTLASVGRSLIDASAEWPVQMLRLQSEQSA